MDYRQQCCIEISDEAELGGRAEEASDFHLMGQIFKLHAQRHNMH
jgi:hypothetical protein